MDFKPLITCGGDERLFASIRNHVIDGLPRESVEWKRSHLRNPKLVYVSANFIPFSEDRLPLEGTKNLLGQAFFHIYWTECHDVDEYKQHVKESIHLWLSKLKARKIYDWLIVIVNNSDSKKSSKTKLLPRQTVLDKVKSDFPSQGALRCISLTDPHRNDSRSADSMQILLQRIRNLLLQAYSRQLALFEDHMRTQREMRNEVGWNFHDFFFLQEELAFVLEMLGVYDEALVQYDELDALFTQFVINANVGDMPEWLTLYSKPCNIWSGMCLLRSKCSQLRKKLLAGDAGLLDLRNYLFSRQCSILLLLCRPWEVAQRTLEFLHNCICEFKTLEIAMPPGAVACWVILSCFEVLQTCEKFSDTSQIKEYSVYCSGLWTYTREKLHDLGILCGLMPDLDANSEKLHIVVNLLTGMEDDPYPAGQDSPHSKLRSALSSKESFLKHYLELSELTMGTFKHNRRIRTARVIGRDLAQFYMKMKQPQKAIPFLTDLVKTYREENWELLTANIQQDLLKCYLMMEDVPRYIKTCIRLAVTICFNFDLRKDYFQEIISCSEKLGSDPLLLRTEKTILVTDIQIEPSVTPIIRHSEIVITFHLQSNLPSEIICRNIKLYLKKLATLTTDKAKNSETIYLMPKPGSSNPISPMGGGLGIPSRDEMQQRILVQPQLVIGSYKQDGSMVHSVMCKNTQQVLRRRDSQGFHKDDIEEEESGRPCFKVSMVKLVPGHNVVSVTVQPSDSGVFAFHRLWLEWGNIHFALSSLSPLFSFNVSSDPPTVSRKLTPRSEVEPKDSSLVMTPRPPHWKDSYKDDLIAGIEQEVILEISSGSHSFDGDSSIHLRVSRGLKLKNIEENSEWSEEIDIQVPKLDPFSSGEVAIKVKAQYSIQRNANSIEHFVNVQSPWPSSIQRLSLTFLPPFFISQKLHTCGFRKYVQVIVHGTTAHRFHLVNTELELGDQKVVPLKKLSTSDKLVISAHLTASFVWEILTEDQNSLPSYFIFSVEYKSEDAITCDTSKCNLEFRLNNYQTMFAVRAKMEPPKGSEFCRVGILCFMHISINQICKSSYSSLMYEVMADQTMWTVCGKTAGVVNVDDTEKYTVILDVKPLISGFLPLPTVRLSKYIPGDQKKPVSKESTPSKDSGSYNVARLEPFDTGQIYNWSRAVQVHVLPASNSINLDVSS